MTIIDKGIAQGLIRLDADKKFIYYTKQGDKKRNYNNPEEKVQAEVYLKLIFTYGYVPERIIKF